MDKGEKSSRDLSCKPPTRRGELQTTMGGATRQPQVGQRRACHQRRRNNPDPGEEPKIQADAATLDNCSLLPGTGVPTTARAEPSHHLQHVRHATCCAKRTPIATRRRRPRIRPDQPLWRRSTGRELGGARAGAPRVASRETKRDRGRLELVLYDAEDLQKFKKYSPQLQSHCHVIVPCCTVADCRCRAVEDRFVQWLYGLIFYPFSRRCQLQIKRITK
ncbi:hypothetical protein BRADI_1g54502v3 [Brachypodium distachyon]|uniref:Uncharacterized protein n=1 Tax=Brachypodium distachyon TaxID=15368 RepID=A0A0Q3LBF7_BRADI|nr:hypothetical protein BRADI_1g54502v3 [Brachypodium distachyon]